MIPDSERAVLARAIEDALAFGYAGDVQEGYKTLDLGLAWAQSVTVDPHTGRTGTPEPWAEELTRRYRVALVSYCELFSLVEVAPADEPAELVEVVGVEELLDGLPLEELFGGTPAGVDNAVRDPRLSAGVATAEEQRQRAVRLNAESASLTTTARAMRDTTRTTCESSRATRARAEESRRKLRDLRSSQSDGGVAPLGTR